MQYFVSAENSSYFYWQLELLIESFVMKGMEDDLVIGLAENDAQKIRGYSQNLVKYGSKFIHENEGREMGYLPLNRVGALRYALAYGILKFPFVMIHSDMILRNPISLSQDDDPYGIIVNNYEDLSGSDTRSIKEELDFSLAKLAEERKVEESEITRMPFFSVPVVFNSPMEYVADTFFSKLQANMVRIFKEKGKEFPCERAAWELTIAESFQHLSTKGRFMSASLLHEDANLNFIHYKNGIPPVFHKKFYKYENGMFYGDLGPYETILEHNPTVNTNFMHQVIRSYARKNSR